MYRLLIIQETLFPDLRDKVKMSRVNGYACKCLTCNRKFATKKKKKFFFYFNIRDMQILAFS